MTGCWHWIAGIIGSVGLSCSLWAEPVGLLYPDVREPYQQVFLNISEGAEAQLRAKLRPRIVSDKTTAGETLQWLRADKVVAVIALSQGSADVLPSGVNLPVVLGAVSAQAPERYSAVSLNPSPQHLFAGLRQLLPDAKTVHVVFDANRNQWEVEQAQTMAAAMGLTLKGYPTNDLREAATTFRDVQNAMDAKTDALWLPLGGPARDKSIMQNILETAWVKGQAVFSSNLADVKRGVLFAMYPDNVGMGREIAQLLQQVQANPQLPPQTLFVTALFKAVNRRTAEHLEIRLGNQELNSYDFVYPPR